jgi:predicted nuclease with TOPRIM domain
MQIINNNERHAKQLEQEITQYQDYAKRIKILSVEIDRLTGENRGLEEDIKKLRLRYADQISA